MFLFWQFHLGGSEASEDVVCCGSVQRCSLAPIQIVLPQFLKGLRSFSEDVVALYTPVKLPLADELPDRLLGLLSCLSDLYNTVNHTHHRAASDHCKSGWPCSQQVQKPVVGATLEMQRHTSDSLLPSSSTSIDSFKELISLRSSSMKSVKTACCIHLQGSIPIATDANSWFRY